jgi:hypothetical protein
MLFKATKGQQKDAKTSYRGREQTIKEIYPHF